MQRRWKSARGGKDRADENGRRTGNSKRMEAMKGRKWHRRRKQQRMGREKEINVHWKIRNSEKKQAGEMEANVEKRSGKDDTGKGQSEENAGKNPPQSSESQEKESREEFRPDSGRNLLPGMSGGGFGRGQGKQVEWQT